MIIFRIALLTICIQGAIVAQSLALEAEGGGLPGSLELAVGPGKLGASTAILMSVSAGPTPLRLIDQSDPRVLQVGAESLGLSIMGYFLPPTLLFKAPSIKLPDRVRWHDAAVYFQAITLNWQGQKHLIGPISNPVAVRFGPGRRFRDRKKPLAQARVFHQVSKLPDGKFIVTGGGTGTLVNCPSLTSTEIYDPISDSWSAGPSMLKEHGIHQTVRLKDGRLLVIAGVNKNAYESDVCEIYDPKTNKFTLAPPLIAKRFAHHAILLDDGRVMVTGGISQLVTSNPLATLNTAEKLTEFYDPKTNKWTRGPNMNDPRAAHSTIKLPDGRIMAIGGLGWTQFIIKIPTVFATTEIYDPKTNKWTRGPSMAVPRAATYPVKMSGDRWLLAGGVNQVTIANPGTPTAAVEIFDLKKMSWKQAGRLSFARALSYTIEIGKGRFMAIGGALGSVTAPTAMATTEVYDEASDKWTPGPRMTTSRATHVPMVVNGQICLIAGGSGTGSVAVASTEWYFK